MTNELAPELKAHLESLKPASLTADELTALRNHAYPAREHGGYPFADQWRRLPGKVAAQW